uniref:Chibby 1, beta catenin antagonist n=1 Tax=Lates calcarifer TaxID=8187 RepID=A0A4W6BR24_LATCA
MPLFGNTFSPKKTPPRKSASLSSLTYGEFRELTLDRSTREIELGLEYGPPVMNIGGQSWKFEDGQWITETTVEYHLMEKEVEDIKTQHRRKK